jgi:ketosteroid isomerase-like protein
MRQSAFAVKVFGIRSLRATLVRRHPFVYLRSGYRSARGAAARLCSVRGVFLADEIERRRSVTLEMILSDVRGTAPRREQMDGDVELLKRIYDRFNARDIDAALSMLADNVAWANGMDGGHIHGREAVREYWTRQWSMVSPHVEPVSFHRTADGAIVAEVRQTVRDLEGKPLQGQTHGLKDKTVGHVFRLREGKVARFDIQDG